MSTAMPVLPMGTITFLFSDIEGSTRLLQRLGERYGEVLDRHAELVRSAVQENNGVEVSTEGDSFFVVFQLATEAVACAVAVQRALHDEPWPPDGRVGVRLGLHTGEGRVRGESYVGIDVHRAARIGNCCHGGQILLSAATASLSEHALPPGTHLLDLGKHELKDLAYPEHLFQLTVEGFPEEFPPLRTATAPTNNLPVRDTAFIGRDNETKSLMEALSSHRLVTLAGVAGVGKTSLAIHAADRTASRFPDGVWFIEIARLSDQSQIPSAVARALKISEPSLDHVGHGLSGRLAHALLLLILDGCEHLVPGVAAFAEDLLHKTAAVHLLVTTREPLSLSAEHLLRLAPLATPPASVQDPEGAMTFDAVALFADRARQVRADFRIDDHNVQTVGDISRRLDGIPLAIELAVAQMKMLSIRHIAERLGREFASLAGSRRDALPHQRTLRATLDWSYDSLTPAEQLLLVRLSVFAGGFTLEALEDMCCGGLVDHETIVDLLGRLVDTSLVLVDYGDPVRYRLLEPVAQYARSRLPEHEDPDGVHRRHADYFLRLAEEAEPELLGRRQVAWLHRLDHERYNLLGALNWLHGASDAQGVLRIAAALRLYWMMRRDVVEGSHWLEEAVDNRSDASPGAVIRALNGVALLAIRRLAFERAGKSLQEALSLARELGDASAAAAQLAGLSVLAWFGDDDEDRADALAAEVQAGKPDWWTLSWSLAIRGTLARVRGDHQAAGDLLGESHRLLLDNGGSLDLGWSYLRLGVLAKDEGRYAPATQYLQEGRILLAEAGDRIGLAHADAGLGALAWLRGDRDLAMNLYESVLAGFGRAEDITDNLFELRTMLQGRVSGDQLRQIAQWNRERIRLGEQGMRAALAEHLFHLGNTAFGRGEFDRARKAFEESLVLTAKAEDVRGATIALIALGRVSAAEAELEEAVLLLSCAERLAERDGFSPWPPVDEPEFARHVQDVREKMGAQEFSPIWERGRDLTLDGAMELLGIQAI